MFHPRTLSMLIALLFALLPTLTFAQNAAPISAKKTVNLDVTKGDLHTVVLALERQAGIQCVIRDTDQPYKAVYVHLADMPLSKALRVIALSAGARVSRSAEGLYLFEPGEDSAAPPLMAAEKAPEAPKPPDKLTWRIITLQHTLPGDVVKLMHWDTSGSGTASLALPSGVAHVLAPPRGSSLLVEASDDGFNQVHQIVKILDVVPRPVQIETVFVTVPKALVAGLLPSRRAAGNTADELLRQPWERLPEPAARPVSAADTLLAELRRGKAAVFPPSRVTINNNQSVTLAENLPTAFSPLAVTPRVNSDDSVTLNLGPQVTEPAWPPSGSGPPRITQRVTTLRTARSGEMLWYDLGFFGAKGDKALLFVTPTILPATNAVLPAQQSESLLTRWYVVTLQHTGADALIKLMHWQAAAGASSNLPAGVEQVTAVEDENILMLQATPDGFTQIKQIVAILDVAAHTFVPHIAFFNVPGIDSGLHYADPPTADLEVSGGEVVTAAFQRLIQAGYMSAPVKALSEFQSNAPLSWIVAGFSIASPRLNSDDSLTLTFTPLNGLVSGVTTQRVQRGGILAVRQKGKPNIIFIKVEY